eukprot:gene15001-17738_t
MLQLIDEIKTMYLTKGKNDVANIATAQSTHQEITESFQRQQAQLDIVIKDLTQKLIDFEKDMKREDSDDN